MKALLRLLLIMLPWAIASAAHAQDVRGTIATSIRSLPPLPASGNGLLRLVAIDGRLAALTSRAAWLLSPRRDAWRQAASAALDPRASVASNGRRAVVLSGGVDAPSSVATLAIEGDRIASRPLPPLPVALRSAMVAVSDDVVIVAGVASDGQPRLYSLTGATSTWRQEQPWPGGAPAAVAAQNGGLFVTLANGRHWRWSKANGWRAGAAAPGAIVPGSARAVGQAYLLYLVQTANGARLYSYSAITDAWAPLGGAVPGAAQAATAYGDGIAWAAHVGDHWSIDTTTIGVARTSLGAADWIIIGVYLFAMLGIGLHFYRRAKRGPSSEFFLGSRAIPFWAAGISMFAGSISSISYLAVPAKAFETNWEYIMSKITTCICLVFVAIVVVPLFRRLRLVSVFNYLETRFHPVIRMLSSALWMLMQIGGRMGIVLYLPAMAIGTITDTNIIACIIVVGLFTIVYTALGGMRAVVWTDVFQVLVLTSGALFAIGYIVWQIGLHDITAIAAAYDKTKMFNFSFDVSQSTVWAFMILALFDVVLTFPKDQVLMQRVLATPSAREASRSVWLFAVILLPSAFMFYIVGTALFAYYRARPGHLNPMLPIDSVFPAFIGTELPHGVVGMIIAGLIAAAMGTLSGIINSVATLLSVDFYQKARPDVTERQVVRFAEVASVGVGLVGIAIAIILSRLDIHSLLDLTIELFGLLGGSCAGAYTLGMFTRRANWQGVAIGIVLASIITLVVWLFGLIHPYLYLALAIASSIAIGYVASLFFPPPAQSLEGLTIFSRPRHVIEEGEPSTQPS